MKKELEIEQSVSFSQEDFSSDMKNNIVQATDPTGKTVLAIDTWKYAIYFLNKKRRSAVMDYLRTYLKVSTWTVAVLVE